ncbi:ATP-binding region ATPase domain protein [Gemmatirosa kalamazoonensis]|uniref:histidine kinase n=1 Tax=Gemmatirosa kalamazoonensis TaxID=861299 RepID=W0RL27_9BACT|nr:ATP-binding protein [Gemmatirosa kalamazoonensis]AHG90138.1 ATP-binding region ATPase domain protein [Gemmatirosa kalamazoonensis]
MLLNAVDACAGGGRIAVRVSPTRLRDCTAVVVAVADTGCGIAPTLLPRIWDPYVTHKPSGTGLGLAIARQTVMAHGGAVEAESAEGRGTEIRFILPVAGPPASAESWSVSA